MGYDLGSSFIHPRADEGFWDAKRIINKERMLDFKRENTLKNTILISNAILIFGANHSQVDFDKYLNYYCSTVFEYLNQKIDFPNLKAIENILFTSLLK